jgi:hypothetical protein
MTEPTPSPQTSLPDTGPANSDAPTRTFLDSQATATFQAQPPDSTQPAVLPQVPGYEVLGVLGRGAMGVVYRARHLSLKRLVALKMILGGGQAGERERARFKSEAEAVARLAHPNIVQVYEVGEWQAEALGPPLPYCALELVEGGTLARKLNGQPLPPREAARLIQTLAQAVHLAHSRNVVHRDLKPANILLAFDPADVEHAGLGTPKVTDFGLARQLDADSGQTQSGAIMGTPTYMAPEQASGQAHLAGPAADVYALGAILYECLTGRPPFKGTSVLDVLEQVRSREPVPPARFQSKVPVDLETVCLKCLRKEPEKRYASATELADELGRFLRGEPVLARPIGRLERAWRWAKRKPALASALTAAMVFLVSGIVAVSLIAVYASRQASEATEGWAEAKRANEELTTKNVDLSLTKDDLEKTLAHTWLLPLARQLGPLAEQELLALKAVSAKRGKAVALRFLGEGITDAELSPRLRGRAEYAWHAALGLDLEQRMRAEELLLTELRSATGEQLDDLAMAAAALGDLSPETATLVADVLNRAMTRTSDPRSLHSLALALSAVAVRMGPKDGAGVCGQAAATLLQTLNKPVNPVAIRLLTDGLTGLAARLDPKAAAETASGLTLVLNRTTNPVAARPLIETLCAVSLRMEPADAPIALTLALEKRTDGETYLALAQGRRTAVARLTSKQAATAGAAVIQLLSQTPASRLVSLLTECLSDLAGRMETADAASVAGLLLEAMSRKGPDMLPSLAQTLGFLIARTGPGESAGLRVQATALLTRAMCQTTEPTQLVVLGKILSIVADRAEPREPDREASRTAATLLQAISQTKQTHLLPSLAPALSAVARWLEPIDAAGVAETLLKTLTGNANLRGALVPVLSAVAARLEPGDTAALAASLTTTITRTADARVLQALAESLAALAGRSGPPDGKDAPEKLTELCGQSALVLARAMSTRDEMAVTGLAHGLSALAGLLGPKEAAEAAGSLLQSLDGQGSIAMQFFAVGFGALAGRLESKQAAEIADALAQLLRQKTDTSERLQLTRMLAAVAARMEPKEAARIAGPAAATFTQAISQTQETGQLMVLTLCLSILAERLEPGQAAAMSGQAAATLIQAMNRTGNPDDLRHLTRSLQTAASRLGPKESARVHGQAGAAFAPMMRRTPDARMVRWLAQDLAGLADRMEPGEATAVCEQAVAVLIPAMNKKDQKTLSVLAEALTVVVARMEPGQAAGRLTQALDQTADANVLRPLTHTLSAVTARMAPGEAAKVSGQAAAALLRALQKEPRDLPTLARLLGAATARMELREAGRTCAQAADTLLAALDRTTDAAVLQSLAEGLATLAVRLGPTEAAAAALTLSQTMSKRTDPRILWPLAQGLAALASRMDRGEATRLCGQAADRLTQAFEQKDADVLRRLADVLAVVTSPVEQEEAGRVCSRAAAMLIEAMCTTDPKSSQALAEGLTAVLSREVASTSRQRALAVAGTVAGWAGLQPWAAAPTLLEAAHVPPPLPARNLVELLRHPLCVGAARRTVLEQLARHYGRLFADQWDFARFALEQKLGLDLLAISP